MKEPQTLMNKPVYLGLLILELSERFMYVFWYDYTIWECGEKSKFCCMDTDSFIVYIKNRKYLQRYCIKCCN